MTDPQKIVYVPRQGDGKWIVPELSLYEHDGKWRTTGIHNQPSDKTRTYLIPIPAVERWVLLERGEDVFQEGDAFISISSEILQIATNYIGNRVFQDAQTQYVRRQLFPDIDALLRERDEAKEREALAVGIVLKVNELLGFSDFSDPSPLYGEIKRLQSQLESVTKDRDESRKENHSLRIALQFYANGDHFQREKHDGEEFCICTDQGATAQEALNGQEAEIFNELKSANENAARLRSEVQSLSDRYKNSQNKLAATTRERDALQAKLTDAEIEVNNWKKWQAEAVSLTNSRTIERDEWKARYEHTQAKLTAAESRIQMKDENYLHLRSIAESAEARVKELGDKLSHVAHERMQLESELSTIRAEHEKLKESVCTALGMPVVPNDGQLIIDRINKGRKKYLDITTRIHELAHAYTTESASLDDAFNALDMCVKCFEMDKQHRAQAFQELDALKSSLRWIAVSERMPKQEDAGENNLVEVVRYDGQRRYMAWNFVQYDQVIKFFRKLTPGPEPAKTEAQRIYEAYCASRHDADFGIAEQARVIGAIEFTQNYLAKKEAE
jgi:hypothetical protein